MKRLIIIMYLPFFVTFYSLPAWAEDEDFTVTGFKHFCLDTEQKDLSVVLSGSNYNATAASAALLAGTILAPTAVDQEGWEIRRFLDYSVSWLLLSYKSTEQGVLLQNCGLISNNLRASEVLKELESTLSVERWYFGPLDGSIQHAYKLTGKFKDVGIRVIAPDFGRIGGNTLLESISVATFEEK